MESGVTPESGVSLESGVTPGVWTLESLRNLEFVVTPESGVRSLESPWGLESAVTP